LAIGGGRRGEIVAGVSVGDDEADIVNEALREEEAATWAEVTSDVQCF
jgi:hypothetical protein